jgi:hypothetical protein
LSNRIAILFILGSGFRFGTGFAECFARSNHSSLSDVERKTAPSYMALMAFYFGLLMHFRVFICPFLLAGSEVPLLK